MKDKIIREWIQKAEEDLKVVKRLLDDKEPLTGAICFHSQQAVEKYLKAYLTHHNVRVKKIHDMASILDLCIKQDRDFENLDKEGISNLTFYAIEVRYPEEFYVPSAEEARACSRIAEEVKGFIIEKLNMKNE